MHGQTLHMRAMWPNIGLRTSLAAFAVVGCGMVCRGWPGPRATSVKVSGERAKIIGERYMSIGASLSELQAMVERCAPRSTRARGMRHGRMVGMRWLCAMVARHVARCGRATWLCWAHGPDSLPSRSEYTTTRGLTQACKASNASYTLLLLQL